MSNTLLFKTFCIEQYKEEHNLSGKETLDIFNKYGVLEYLQKFYDILHTTGEKYLVEEIDLFINARKIS